MARLNLEDTFWVAIGRVERGQVSYDQLIGNAVRFLRFAQEQYKKGQVITHEQWSMEGFLDCLVPIFAEKNDQGYDARNASEQFDWLKQKVEAGRRGGVASGETRRSNSDELPEAARSVSKRAEPSSSSSSSLKNELLRNSSPSRKSAPVTHVQEADLLRLEVFESVGDWQDIYSKDYVKTEFVKMSIWLKANPKKARKTHRGWVQFVANWLERGWDKSTTRGPSVKVEQSDGWNDSAVKVAQCLRMSGNWTADREQVVALLGEELYHTAIKAGVYKMRNLPAGDFYIRGIIGLLKESKIKTGGTQ